jgi:3'(2'), 5'-bisphosphate nucleotidase
MTGSLKAELDVAIRAATAAARLCRAVQEQMVELESIPKEDKSPVTIADFGSQAVICRILREAFPADPILAEETASALRQSTNRPALERVAGFVSALFPDASPDRVCQWIDWGEKAASKRHWCLDPIDGTKGFMRRDQYAVALALILEGEVALGVLACPNLPLEPEDAQGSRGTLFYAMRGKGAFQVSLEGGKERPIRVSGSVAGDPSLRFCESFESGHSDHEGQARLARALGITAPSIRMDSQAKYGIVARGEADIYLRLPNPRTPGYTEKVWDHAAGSILIQEAGGKVTDIHGRVLKFGLGERLTQNTGVVATNGLVHGEVLQALGPQGERSPAGS